MKKKVIGDVILNIISTTIPTIVLQLLILPQIANHVSGDQYGLMVTILSVLNVIPATIGNALNNVRLLYQDDYKQKNLVGDFRLLHFILETINMIIVFICSIYYMGVASWGEALVIVVIGIIWAAREYYIVAFRIVLNYKAILTNNIWLVVGYAIGYGIFRLTTTWECIYLGGLITSLIYIFSKTDLYKEPVSRTELFTKVTKDTVFFIIAASLAKLVNYADKMLLYPLMGGTMVSIYYVATLFGKVVSLAITPINSVALSYLSKINKKPNSIFKWTVISGGIICIIGYFSAVIMSRPVLGLLYPAYVDEAMKYIYVTSASVVVGVMTSIINPFVLKFFDMKWQIYVNGFTAIFYIAAAFVLLKEFGLMGFCYGALLANLFKMLYTLIIYIRVKEKEVQ